jgi:hypothetical protein
MSAELSFGGKAHRRESDVQGSVNLSGKGAGQFRIDSISCAVTTRAWAALCRAIRLRAALMIHKL